MATSAELAILLKLQDEFSSEMKKPTTAVTGFGASLKNAQSIASGFLAAQAVQKGLGLLESGFKASMKAANDQAQAERQLNSVLEATHGAAGVTANAALDMSQQFQKTTRIQDEVVLSAENMLLTFTNIKANIFPQTTQAVLDMATAMSGGAIPTQEKLQETAIQVGKALNDPIKGMTALQRVGVMFTEQQKAQVKTMVDSGNVLGAQKMILSELQTEFGGAAEKMTPFERNVDKVKDAIEGAKESVGFFIMGGLNIMSQWLSDHGDDIMKFVGKFGGAFDLIKSQVGTQIGGIIGFVKDAIKAVEGLADFVSDLANGNWAAAWHDLEGVALDVVGAMLNQMAALFGQLPNLAIDAINEMIKAWDSVQGKLSGKVNLPKILGGGNVNPLSGANLNIGPLDPINMKPFDFSSLKKGFDEVAKSGKDLSKASGGAATSIGDLGDASKKSAEEIFGDAMSKIRSAASQLLSQPTRDFATLDLAIAKEVQAHASVRPAIQSSIDSYNADADAHEAAAQAIEDSVARIDEVLQTQIDQAQDHVAKLQAQYDKEDQVRAQAQKLADRAAQDAADAADQAQQAQQRSLQDKLDSLNDQKSALPSGSEGDDQRKALDSQINDLQDSLKAASRAGQDYSHALDEATKQQTRANEDAQSKLDAQRKKEQDDAQASLVWQQKQKDIADKRAKDEADAERAAAGKAKDAAEAEKRQLDNMDKEEAAMKLRLDALNGEHEIMKKQLVLADASLLTEAGLKQKVDDLIPVTFTLTSRLQDAAHALGFDLAGGVASLIVQLDRLKDLPAVILAGFGGGGQIPGHKLGLDRVPYDNYLMYAHKDERVLTADEAKAYGNQSTDNSKRTTIYGNVINNFGGGGSASTDLALARLN